MCEAHFYDQGEENSPVLDIYYTSDTLLVTVYTNLLEEFKQNLIKNTSQAGNNQLVESEISFNKIISDMKQIVDLTLLNPKEYDKWQIKKDPL